MTQFQDAQEKWVDFLENKIQNYEKFRNFDYGPENVSSVSKLSPYVSHRILLEYELIEEVKKKYQSQKINKFIEEIYWRIYWKGWMENRPNVWVDFISEKNFKYDFEAYEKAINGDTDLSFFNSWVNELKTHNYLHNHTRMWFASTWIFNFGLPWELGANFFFKHLYDGDSASNILSWRWVAGLQTKGKQYLFSPSNLRKFSNNRFNVEKINNKQIFLEELNQIPLTDEIYKSNMEQKSESLILFENDLHAPTLKNIFQNYKRVFIILLGNEQRKIKLSSAVMSFKQQIVSEFVAQFDNVTQLNTIRLQENFKDINQLDMIYPGIGDNNDFIKNFKISNNKVIFNLVRDQDLFAWKFAKKGFFKFKENIPKINKYIFQN
ncbi:DNA photolyase-like protein [Prochlorococcus marinus str. MIT 9515]|uniref:DNA photolyase-like protein n=1 Tax=Prochlorococcus marinus (strain MIT 9515) TaxID=167542 RepID=A2BY68_PROM5|nr:FAD-binding domain-containing protein [Prochlorococcus marinus]ABM72729.1 DNA photolyase-like protein [Prochlorococcus marinus str. MIT 9515]